jgi:hypothetical protein
VKKLDVDAFADLHNVLRSKVGTLFALSGKKTAYTDKGREGKSIKRADNKIFQPLSTVFEDM